MYIQNTHPCEQHHNKYKCTVCPKKILKVSISKALVNVPFVHLYDVINQIFSHNCATFQTKYSNGH